MPHVSFSALSFRTPYMEKQGVGLLPLWPNDFFFSVLSVVISLVVGFEFLLFSQCLIRNIGHHVGKLISSRYPSVRSTIMYYSHTTQNTLFKEHRKTNSIEHLPHVSTVSGTPWAFSFHPQKTSHSSHHSAHFIEDGIEVIEVKYVALELAELSYYSIMCHLWGPLSGLTHTSNVNWK